MTIKRFQAEFSGLKRQPECGPYIAYYLKWKLPHDDPRGEKERRNPMMEKTMSKRCVDKLAVVFALTGHDELDLPQNLSTHVMFVYDKQENKKQFTILNKRIPEEMSTKIRAWLEAHLERYETIYGLN
jgi:hypothetical protein